MPVRGHAGAALVGVLLVALRGRESLAGLDVAAVDAAGSAASGEDPLHAAKAAKATRSGAGRFLIESQR